MRMTQRLVDAANAYEAEKAKWESIPYHFANLDHPPPPIEHPMARAGKMIRDSGIVAALMQCVGMGMDGTFDSDNADWWRDVAINVVIAAQEVADQE